MPRASQFALLTSVVLLALAACNLVSARPQWRWERVETGLPHQAIVPAVAADPQQPARLWAAMYASGGLVASTDGGQTWTTAARLNDTPVFDLLPIYSANQLMMWAATRQGVFVSRDAGLTWQPETDSLPRTAVFALAADTAGWLYAGLDNHGVYAKTHAAANWRPLSGPNALQTAAVLSLAVSPGGQQIYAGTAGRGLFASPDGGRSWRHAAPDTFIANLAVNPVHPQQAIAGTRRLLLRTSDGGESWQPFRPPWEQVELTALLWLKSGLLFAGTAAGQVYVSRDEGSTWTPLTPNPITNGGVLDLAATSEVRSRLLAGTWTGIYTSDDKWQQWVKLAPRLGKPQAFTLLKTDHSLLLGAQTGLYRWQTETARWTRIAGWPAETGVMSLVRGRGSTLFAGTTGNGVYRSDDRGQTWRALPSLKTGAPALAVDPSDPDRVYMLALWERVYESRDGGQTWRARWLGLRPDMEAISIAIEPGRSTVHLGVDNGLFLSRDGGPWVWEIADFLDQSVLALMVQTLPDEVGGGSVLYIGTTRGAFRSVDGGRTVQGGEGPSGWGHGLENVSVTAFLTDPHDPRRLYAGTAYAGVYQSMDWGFTWRSIGPPELAGEVVKSLAWGPEGELFIAAPGGVWRGKREATP